MDCSPPVISVHEDSPGKNTGVGCHALLQGIFLSQRSNPGLSHCRQILYYLSHQESPRILEWVAMPSSRGSSWPRDWIQVSRITGRFFTIWASREAQAEYNHKIFRPQVLPVNSIMSHDDWQPMSGCHTHSHLPHLAWAPALQASSSLLHGWLSCMMTPSCSGNPYQTPPQTPPTKSTALLTRFKLSNQTHLSQTFHDIDAPLILLKIQHPHHATYMYGHLPHLAPALTLYGKLPTHKETLLTLFRLCYGLSCVPPAKKDTRSSSEHCDVIS